MERSRVRRFGVKAVVCAVSCVSLFGGSPLGAAPSTNPIELEATSEAPGVVIFPARVPGPHPITVLLHGMCGDAARACSHFADQVTQTSNLVCPRASARCSGGGASWPETGVAEAVEAAVMRAKGALPEVDETHGRTLIGYSLGAYRAVNIAHASGSKYPRVMLIGARVSLDRARLVQNGTERVLLCAGAWDMTHDPMQREAERMRRTGFQARFLDLGPVGHAFAPSFAEHLPQALSWLNGA
ncbi:MAG: hypothetical protein ABUL62_04295 [Myxococcales bacterium]